MQIEVPVSVGEAIDKLTILEIKLARIADPAKRANIERERALLAATLERTVPRSPQLSALTGALRVENEALWAIEDGIRERERAKDFGPAFVELARSVYRHNDRRAALKKEINLLLGSTIVEEKSYQPY